MSITFDYVILERSDCIGTIKLNRPEAQNALNVGIGEDVVKALELCTNDEDVRAVVITGAGKAFCAGGDVALFERSEDISGSVDQVVVSLNRVVSSIRRTPKPVVAMINGVAAGGGISLAAACDMRVCGKSVKFKQAYTSIGLVPDGGWALSLPLLVGYGKAAELALLDPLLNADQALEYGLVNRVVEDADLVNVTYEIVSKIAEGPTASFALVKENLNHSLFGFLEQQLELERRGITMAGKSPDAKEGIAAFMEKRKAQFEGR